MSICQIEFKAKKPCHKPYPKEFKTYGDHLRKKRLDLNLKQSQVAKIIKVTPDCITNWELNQVKPQLRYIPKIISFLGYSPVSEINKVKKYRIENGLTQKELANKLNVDPTTVARIEKGSKKIKVYVQMKLDILLSKV